MSIELKQAAQQALDAFEAFGEADDFATLFTLTQKMNALRTAIQRAEREQVAWPLRAQVWKRERESTQEWVLEIAGTLGDTDMNIRHTQPLSVAYENVPGLPTFYTRPAPGVPDAVARDAERYQHVKQNLPLIDEYAIDSAMAAAQAQKGQP